MITPNVKQLKKGLRSIRAEVRRALERGRTAGWKLHRTPPRRAA